MSTTRLKVKQETDLVEFLSDEMLRRLEAGKGLPEDHYQLGLFLRDNKRNFRDNIGIISSSDLTNHLAYLNELTQEAITHLEIAAENGVISAYSCYADELFDLALIQFQIDNPAREFPSVSFVNDFSTAALNANTELKNKIIAVLEQGVAREDPASMISLAFFLMTYGDDEKSILRGFESYKKFAELGVIPEAQYEMAYLILKAHALNFSLATVQQDLLKVEKDGSLQNLSYILGNPVILKALSDIKQPEELAKRVLIECLNVKLTIDEPLALKYVEVKRKARLLLEILDERFLKFTISADNVINESKSDTTVKIFSVLQSHGQTQVSGELNAKAISEKPAEVKSCFSSKVKAKVWFAATTAVALGAAAVGVCAVMGNRG